MGLTLFFLLRLYFYERENCSLISHIKNLAATIWCNVPPVLVIAVGSQ